MELTDQISLDGKSYANFIHRPQLDQMFSSNTPALKNTVYNNYYHGNSKLPQYFHTPTNNAFCQKRSGAILVRKTCFYNMFIHF